MLLQRQFLDEACSARGEPPGITVRGNERTMTGTLRRLAPSVEEDDARGVLGGESASVYPAGPGPHGTRHRLVLDDVGYDTREVHGCAGMVSMLEWYR